MTSPDLPLVSIVTASYNMGRFIGETIESVLAQDYPDIEYIVMDGGSTDDTLSILNSYGERLQYHSGPDQGTADAINNGFARSRGSILAFLHADDTYLPGAVSTAVNWLREHEEVAAVYGDAYWVDEGGQIIGPYPTRPFDAGLLRQECFICQPASFFRRAAFEQAGAMDARLHFTFDYDLWIRMARFAPLGKLDGFLATSRMHKSNKTIGQRKAVLVETMDTLYRHYRFVPAHWVGAYVAYLFDGKDQFFEQSELSIPAYGVVLLFGLRRNRRHPLRFIREWAGGITWRGLWRRINRFLAWGR